MNELKKGKRIDNVKPRTRIGKIAQKKVQELVKEKIGKKLSKNKGNKEINNKCWDLRDKIARLKYTKKTMLTDKGRKMLDFAKNGLKDID